MLIPIPKHEHDDLHQLVLAKKASGLLKSSNGNVIGVNKGKAYIISNSKKIELDDEEIVKAIASVVYTAPNSTWRSW